MQGSLAQGLALAGALEQAGRSGMKMVGTGSTTPAGAHTQSQPRRSPRRCHHSCHLGSCSCHHTAARCRRCHLRQRIDDISLQSSICSASCISLPTGQTCSYLPVCMSELLCCNMNSMCRAMAPSVQAATVTDGLLQVITADDRFPGANVCISCRMCCLQRDSSF